MNGEAYEYLFRLDTAYLLGPTVSNPHQRDAAQIASLSFQNVKNGPLLMSLKTKLARKTYDLGTLRGIFQQGFLFFQVFDELLG
jgi:hypothetical protein